MRPSVARFESSGIQSKAAISAISETRTENDQKPCHPPMGSMTGAMRKLRAVPRGIKADQKPVCLALVVLSVNSDTAVGPAIIIIINPIPSSALPDTRPI